MKKIAPKNHAEDQFQDNEFLDILENTPEIIDSLTDALRDQQETALELTRLAVKYSSNHADKSLKHGLTPENILDIFKKSAQLIKTEFPLSN